MRATFLLGAERRDLDETRPGLRPSKTRRRVRKSDLALRRPTGTVEFVTSVSQVGRYRLLQRFGLANRGGAS